MLKVHPKFLTDSRLLALWREGLSGQRQIHAGYFWADFNSAPDPLRGIGAYLSFIASEGLGRGFKMNHELILYPNFDQGQLRLSIEELKREYALLQIPPLSILQSNPVYELQH